jgi:tetratricopeptide (TPR) repeat protein
MTRLVLGLLVTAAAFAQHSVKEAIELNNQGNRASESNDYGAAAGYYRQSIQIWSELGEEYDAHRASVLMNLGTVLCGAGRRMEGATAFEGALALHRKTLGMHHERTVVNMNLLAANYLMIGETQKAETLLDEVLPIARAEFSNNIQSARSLEVLTGVLDRRGRVQEAITPAREALDVSIRVAGDSSIETALAYANAAEAHRSAGEYDSALPLYRKAHALYEQFLGPNHPRVATILSQEGLVAMYAGKLSTAEQSLLRATTSLKQNCPDCLVELAVAENNLGLLRLKQKRYREAGEILAEAVALRERFSSRPTQDLAASLQTLAMARKAEHRDEDAARLNSRAAAILAFQ